MNDLSFDERAQMFAEIVNEAAELLNLEVRYGFWWDNPNGPLEWEGLTVWANEDANWHNRRRIEHGLSSDEMISHH